MAQINKDILKQLTNSISLFGGDEEILDIVRGLSDRDDNDTLEMLKNWNMAKIDEIKNRLARCTSQAVNVTHLS